jgi:hypothetical protein
MYCLPIAGTVTRTELLWSKKVTVPGSPGKARRGVGKSPARKTRMGKLFGRILHGPWTLSELYDDVRTMKPGKIRTYSLKYDIDINPDLLEEGLNRQAGKKRYRVQAYKVVSWLVVVKDIRPQAKRVPLTLLPLLRRKRRKPGRRKVRR